MRGDARVVVVVPAIAIALRTGTVQKRMGPVKPGEFVVVALASAREREAAAAASHVAAWSARFLARQELH